MKLPQKGGAWLSGEAVQSERRRYPKGTSYGRTPSDEPKSRKLHLGEFVGSTHVSPPIPRIKARFQRAASEPFGVSFSSIFLHEKKDGATGGRVVKNAAGKNVKQTTGLPEGRRFRRAVSNHVKQTTQSHRRAYRKENAR